jgi:hypothetical protein
MPLQGSDGEAEVYAWIGRTTGVMLALAGPVAGGAAAALLLALGARLQFLPLQVIGWVALVLDLANLIPFRFRGHRSDGSYLLEALRRETARAPYDDAIEAIADRWLVLVTNPRPTFDRCSPGILTNVLVVLNRARNDRSPESRALIRLALAGWCWRRAERGDAAPIRDHVLDVRHSAALRSRTREETLVAAASELAHREADLASASPTGGSLGRGFESALTVKTPDSLPEDQQLFAFRFGVAMHDVVSIAG